MATAFLPPPSATAAEWLDSDNLYEVVDGERVEGLVMSTFANIVSNRLAFELNSHVKSQKLGEAFHEGLFRLPLKIERQRRPDIAFISTSRWPINRPISYEGNAWEIVPDLAIEVVSPTDRAEELAEKIGEYFAAGVIQVWVVYPLLKSIQVHESAALARSYYETEILTGGTILPGFQLTVGSIFPPRS